MKKSKPSKSVVIVDFLSYGNSHLNINLFWLAALESYFEDVTCVVETGYAETLGCENSRIKYLKIFRKGFGWRVVREFLFIFIIIKYRKYNIFIMGMTGVMLFCLSILERIFRSNSDKWVSILHSEVEGIRKPVGYSRKFAKYALVEMQ